MYCIYVCLSALALATFTTGHQTPDSKPSFFIGYDQNCFLKDGECFRYVSGSMHYFRVPRAYWKDRMLKMRAAGLNALQTYIEWRSHEPVPGVFDFSENLDFVEFIKTAAEVGLLVILRPGPFIGSERDMGGLPSWLMTMKKNILLRSSDSTYMFYVERYFSKILPMIKPLIYANGGPVITVQIENEYGSYFACDRDYTARLRYVMEQGLGSEVILFTTDGAGDSYLLCGQVDGAYTTVDFGSGGDVNTSFTPQRKREPQGPLVNSEYYPGWLDHWSNPHSLVDADQVAKTLDQMLAINASVNIYMIHGGTSFGYSSGANGDLNTIAFCPTSYDYDAPISEAGDLTNKFMKIREVIGKYLPLPQEPLPKNSTKIAFGPVQLERQYAVIPLVLETPPVTNENPLTFEDLNLDQGFVYYQTKVDFLTTDPVLLSVPGLRDRGYVYVDQVFQGILSRGESIFSMPVIIQPGQNLSIFVESQGRIGYGTQLNDSKGIHGNVSLGNVLIKNWNMWPITFLPENKFANYYPHVFVLPSKLSKLEELNVKSTLPAVYNGEFILPQGVAPSDTFLRLDGWYKGVVGVNDFNLGRYWPITGPQVTLYVPGAILKAYPEKNNITLIELENAPCPETGTGCAVNFVTEPDINSATPVAKNNLYLLTRK